ncbi:MAG: FG-GAP repeat protein [Deltaproteobacteria bacterium]|nr:FG-GAP repeat protein [Deltaproteobacteria bacterium]
MAIFLSSGALAAGRGVDLTVADADIMIVGSSAGMQAGVHAAAAGDLDGDGLGDLLVGSDPDSRSAETDTIYVFLSSGALARGAATRISVDDADLHISGTAVQPRFNRSAQGLGDVDGDGLGDLMLGSVYASGGAGSVYLYLSSGALSGGLTELSELDADLTLTGETEGAYAGEHIEAVGDIDGDGLGDVLVGALGTAADPWMATAYLLLSSGALTARGAAGTLATADLTVQGAQPMVEEYWDRWVEAHPPGARLGDIDGDGRDDLLIHAWHQNFADEFSGDRASIFLTTGSINSPRGELTTDDAEWIIAESSPGSMTTELRSLGDLDGDGGPEIALVARQLTDTMRFQGALFVYRSSGALGTMGRIEKGDYDDVILGEHEGATFGLHLSPMGDLNGDGVSDFAASAPAPSSPRARRGWAMWWTARRCCVFGRARASDGAEAQRRARRRPNTKVRAARPRAPLTGTVLVPQLILGSSPRSTSAGSPSPSSTSSSSSSSGVSSQEPGSSTQPSMQRGKRSSRASS